MDANDMKRLMAAEMHEHDGDEPAIQRVDTPRDRDGIEGTHLRMNGHTVVIERYHKIDPVITVIDSHLRTSQDLDTLIALLQRAKQIIGGA